jgi:actin-related protein
MDRVVFDNGSGFVRVGTSDGLVCEYDCLVGKIRDKYRLIFTNGIDTEKRFIGSEGYPKEQLLQFERPFNAEGVLESADALERIWRKIIYADLVAMQMGERYVIHTYHPWTSKGELEQMVQMWFEYSGSKTASFVLDAQLALHKRRSGVVLDCGESGVRVVPFKDGKCLKSQILRSEAAASGRGQTEELIRRLELQQGEKLTTLAEQEIARDIKAKMAYFGEDLKLPGYEMPDGTIWSVQNGRDIGEVFFFFFFRIVS